LHQHLSKDASDFSEPSTLSREVNERSAVREPYTAGLLAVEDIQIMATPEKLANKASTSGVRLSSEQPEVAEGLFNRRDGGQKCLGLNV
jgi:hypothetical protein